MIDSSFLNEDVYWYKDAIIYELHIKAFFDSNGDGIGDFEGLLKKLDYLEDLGVTAIWLLPFYPSPLKDDGYDIADYYTINPSYGNVKTFKRFIEEAHSRGLKVITELVINHTSDQHPWFQRARTAPAGSPERDYYVWSDDPNKYSDARIIFTDTEPSNWSWDPVAKSYFWHRFFAHQPDLNFDNPDVQEEVFKIMEYWCDMGVDGFRLDAVPYLFEREDTNCENLPETHVFLKKLRSRIDSKYKGKLLLAEANMWPEDSAAYFGEGDECHMNYHFPIMPRMFMAVKMEDRHPIIDIIDQTPDIPEACQWAIFLRNHDELTLEMVTDEERDYMYKVYTKDPQAKINVGIRHRLAPLLENNRNKIELMNVLLFSLPGTPVLYYGDEIGMGDNFYLGDRDGVRTPMQWTADRNAGFSSTNPQKLYLPTIIDPEYKYESVNVEAQQMNSSSLLWWMKRIIGMRKRYKAFGRGDIRFLSPSNSKIIAYTRTFQDEDILVLGNLSRFSQAVELELKGFEGYVPTEVFSHNKFPVITQDSYLFTLAPHGYFWFSLEKEEKSIAERKIELLTAKDWKSIFNTKNKKILEAEILPRYLPERSWFSGGGRVVQQMGIVNIVDMDIEKLPVAICIVEVIYNDGLPEAYQLPLAFVSAERKEKSKEIPKRAILAHVEFDGQKGSLINATHDEIFREYLFNAIQHKKNIDINNESIEFSQGENPVVLDEEPISSRIIQSQNNHTSIIYNNRYFFKLFRRLDTTINPDLEITRYLAEVAHFANAPRFMGSMIYHTQAGNHVALGMLQDFVANHGNGWEYAKDDIQRYFDNVLTRDKEVQLPKLQKNLIDPLNFTEVPERMQNLLGSIFPEHISLLGQRTAEMHHALAAHPEVKDFDNEAFSLHYQRSVFSSLQSLTRSTFDTLKNNVNTLPEEVIPIAKEVLAMRKEVLTSFKKIFIHKFDTIKIRTHGDYRLNQVLWTGKDFVIKNFEGESARPFSERRLRRSPLRDVAAMIHSLHYAAYSYIIENELHKGEKLSEVETWTEAWFYYITRIFMSGYMQHVGEFNFIPADKKDYKILLNTLLLEKAVYELNNDLNNRPDNVIIPLMGIKSLMQRFNQD